MKIPFLMIFTFFGIISAWAAKALEDGKITAAEGFELVTALANVLGVTLEFDVSDYISLASEKAKDLETKQPVHSIATQPLIAKAEE